MLRDAMAIDEQVHRFTTGEVVLERTEPTQDGYQVVTTLRDDDVLDAHVDGVPTTTVSAILPR